MLSGRNRIIVITILSVVLVMSCLFSGTSGKIAGRVIDKETH